MKKLRILLLLLVLPIQLVIAEDNNEKLIISLDCPEKVGPKSNITCKINTKSDIPLTGIKIKTSLTTGLTYKNITPQNNWIEQHNEKEGFVITKIKNTEKENEVAKLNITTPEISENNKYKISLTNIEASDINHKLLTHDNIEKTIQILSDDNTLSSLTISNAKMKTSFNKNITNYEAETTSDNITISATPTNKNAKVSGSLGKEALNYGSNIFTITVTSELGTTRKYTITVIRKFTQIKTNNKSNNIITNKSNDASLKNITIKGHYIPFESNTYNYKLTIPNNEDTIDITATANNNNATVKIDKPNKLEIGDNLITITVTSESGTICKYTITINRKDLSHDKSIQKIIIKNYKLEIKKDIYDYNLTINKENKLKITVILNDKLSTYKIKGNNNLKDGSIITITVTAEDKTSKDYTIKISKKIISDNNLFNNTNLIIIISILLIITTTISLIKKRILK